MKGEIRSPRKQKHSVLPCQLQQSFWSTVPIVRFQMTEGNTRSVFFKACLCRSYTFLKAVPFLNVQQSAMPVSLTLLKILQTDSVLAQSLSHVRLFASPELQPTRLFLSMEFSKQEYWSGLPCRSSGDLPNPGIDPGLLHCRWILDRLSHQRSSSLN